MTSADLYLIAALQSKDDFLLNFTLNELVDISFQPSRRQAILGDLSSKPTLWQGLCQGILVQLKISDTILSNRNGVIRPVTTIGAPASSIGMSSAFPALPVEQPERSVFIRSPPTSKLQANEMKLLAAATSADATVAETASTASTLMTTVVSRATSTLSSLVSLFAFDKEDSKPVQVIESAKSAVAAKSNEVIKAHPHVQSAVESLKSSGQQVKSVIGVLRGEESPAGQAVVAVQPSHWLPEIQGVKQVLHIGVVAWEKLEAGYEPWVAERWARDQVDRVLPRRRLDVNAVKGE